MRATIIPVAGLALGLVGGAGLPAFAQTPAMPSAPPVEVRSWLGPDGEPVPIIGNFRGVPEASMAGKPVSPIREGIRPDSVAGMQAGAAYSPIVPGMIMGADPRYPNGTLVAPLAPVVLDQAPALPAPATAPLARRD